MTEESSFFFSYHKLGALLLCLILNKYIFTFLCYIHYVNILKVIKEPCTCCCCSEEMEGTNITLVVFGM